MKTKMLKCLKLLLPLTMAVGIIAGCSTSDPIKEDLISYVNDQILPLEKEETAIMEAYANETGDNYKSDESLYNTLDNIVPRYLSLTEKLETIRPSTPEVKELHEIYIASSNKAYNAMVEMQAAIENQDSSAIGGINEKLDESRKSSRDFGDKLNQLMKEHKVEMKK